MKNVIDFSALKTTGVCLIIVFLLPVDSTVASTLTPSYFGFMPVKIMQNEDRVGSMESERIVVAQTELHMHKAILKAVQVGYKFPNARKIDSRNIDLRRVSISNIDEFDALQRLMHINRNFVKSWYMGKNSKYKTIDQLLAAMFEKYDPEKTTTPIVPTAFGKRVMLRLAEESYIDLHAGLIMAGEKQ